MTACKSSLFIVNLSVMKRVSLAEMKIKLSVFFYIEDKLIIYHFNLAAAFSHFPLTNVEKN